MLKPLYGLLYTLPGIPAIYYGSEWGATGSRERCDSEVRPCFKNPEFNDLSQHIAWWANYRNHSDILAFGSYHQLEVRREVLVYKRQLENKELIFAVNISAETQYIRHNDQEISLPPYVIKIINF